MSQHSFDLQVARDVQNGVLAAWHEFVTRYSGLIFRLVRRYLADYDDEVRRNAYVDILQYMRWTGLQKYDGRAALSTWVMTISRSRALDTRRALAGRKRDPTWLGRFEPRDREIYRLYFENGEDIPTIRSRLAAQGQRITVVQISRVLVRLESRMDRRLRGRLAYELRARSTAGASGSLLELWDHLRRERAAAEEALRPDLLLVEARMRELLEHVGRFVEQLDPTERAIVELHYFQGLTAPDIADRMHLPGPRRVYTLIDRALGHLREQFDSFPEAPESRERRDRRDRKEEDCPTPGTFRRKSSPP